MLNSVLTAAGRQLIENEKKIINCINLIFVFPSISPDHRQTSQKEMRAYSLVHCLIFSLCAVEFLQAVLKNLSKWLRIVQALVIGFVTMLLFTIVHSIVIYTNNYIL